MGKVLVLTKDIEEIQEMLQNIEGIDNAATLKWDSMYGWKIVIKGTDIYLPRWLNLAIDRKISEAVASK